MFHLGKTHPSYRSLKLAKKIIISQLPLINFWRFHFLKNNFQKSCKMRNFFQQIKKFSKFSFSKNVFEIFLQNFFFEIFLILFLIFLEFFGKRLIFKENFSENLIIENWLMSVWIRLTAFWNCKISSVWH